MIRRCAMKPAIEPISDKIVETLREDIYALRLMPGEPLNRKALQAKFNVSSTAVRDALQALSSEGLIAIHPRARTIVSPIDLEEVRLSAILRLSLELEVVEMACRMEKDIGPEFDAILRAQASALEIGDFGKFSQLDTDFHRGQFEAVGMLPLWTLIQARSSHLNRLRRLNLGAAGNAQLLLDDHKRIVAALRRRDAGEAKSILREHLTRGRLRMAKFQQERPELFL